MRFYYDTRPVYPYICIADVDEGDIQEFIKYLKDRNLSVIKFYEKPKYPASNGITYDYLLRINFENPEKRTKPEHKFINSLFSDFVNQKNDYIEEDDTEKIEKLQTIEIERKYFKQIRTFIDSERKIVELDKQFLKDQLEKLNEIAINLKSEHTRVSKFIEKYDTKVTNEIRNIINAESFNNQQIKNIEKKLSEKDAYLKTKEIELSKQEQELEITKQDYNNYREKLDLEYQTLVKQIKNISLGIEENEENEETIQDLKILIFGDSYLTFNEIFEIFNQLFFQTFGEDLSRKCIEADYLDYKRVKTSNINRKILQNKYDYIIVGPHYHSSKEKNLKQSYTNLAKSNKLKAIISEDYDKKLTREKISELAKYIIHHWESQFKIIE